MFDDGVIAIGIKNIGELVAGPGDIVVTGA